MPGQTVINGITEDEITQKLTLIESLDWCNGFKQPEDFSHNRLKVTRGEVLRNTFSLSAYLHGMQLANMLIGILFLMLTGPHPKPRHQENSKLTDEDSKLMLQAGLYITNSILIVSAILLLSHFVEKQDIHRHIQKGAEPWGVFFRKTIRQYPFLSMLFSDLAMIQAHRAYQKNNLLIFEATTDGIFCLMAFYFACKILQNHGDKLNHCISALDGFLSPVCKKNSACVTAVAEKLNPYLLSCIRKTSEVSKPVIEDIENFIGQNSVDEAAVQPVAKTH